MTNYFMKSRLPGLAAADKTAADKGQHERTLHGRTRLPFTAFVGPAQGSPLSLLDQSWRKHPQSKSKPQQAIDRIDAPCKKAAARQANQSILDLAVQHLARCTRQSRQLATPARSGNNCRPCAPAVGHRTVVRGSDVMKFWLCLLLLSSFQCAACEVTDMAGLKADVENAFSSRSFSAFLKKYGDTRNVQATTEDEYDEVNPTVTLKFDSLSELSRWFSARHPFESRMIVPLPAVCDTQGCKYQLPQSTLHHGTYLLGFGSRKVGQCLFLTQIHIYWG